MKTKKENRPANDENAFDKTYFIKKFGITETEVNMAMAEIHFGTPSQLEEFLQLKYDRKAQK